MTTSVYQAIDGFIAAAPVSEQNAQLLLNKYPEDVQRRLINAMYVGRSNLQRTSLQEPGSNYAGGADHIPKEDFARILYEKNDNVRIYLETVLKCAEASSFDLNSL